MIGNALSLPHLLVIGLVLLVLFGKGKVSGMMGEVGRGISSFKRGLEDGRREIEADARDATPPAGTP